MGFLDSIMGIAKARPDRDDAFVDDYDEEYDDAEGPARKRSFFGSKSSSDEDSYAEEAAPQRKFRAPAIRTPGSGRGVSQQQFERAGNMEVRVVKPQTMSDAQEITEILLSNRTVLMNIEGLNPDIAQRIVDFTSGACYALNGKYEKISEYVHVITPSGVGISGDFHNPAAAAAGYGGYNPNPAPYSDLPFGS